MSDDAVTSEDSGGGSAPDTAGLALDLAMEEARSDPSLREDVAAFLRDQRSLIEIQKHHLQQQFAPQLRQLCLGLWEKRIGVALRAATLAVGLAVAGALSWMVWEAAHSQGLLIEPFTVPTELAARGLAGPAVSNLLLDKLTQLQEQTQSNRPPQSYSNNWGDDLKVEIPETGVSLGELQRYLREWLGHDTHISGEVWQSEKGLSIVARASGSKGDVVTGPESNLDDLMQKVAENIYRVTQPYRYANYLDRDDFHPGFADPATAEKIYRRLIADPRPVERAYAWNGLANLAWTTSGDDRGALDFYHQAVAEDPSYGGAYFGLAYIELNHFSHPEAALAAGRANARTNTGPDRDFWVNTLLGDYAALLPTVQRNFRLGRINRANPGGGLIAYGALHDGAGMRALLRALPPQPPHQNAVPVAWTRFQADVALEDWRAVTASEPAIEKLFLTVYPGWDHQVMFARNFRPKLALARARLGDIAGAEALISHAPSDCYDCLRIRGEIAAAARQWEQADTWFTKAVHDAPSIPFAYEDWGRILLERGQPDAAIVQFQLSNQKGPHFADAIEGWGEALMAKNQSHLAVAKFAQAEKYTPNWGRLHLKWGQALAYAGKPDEAKKHFARAATLDLTPAEKAELARTRS